MQKTVMAGVVAAVLSLVGISASAQAQCVWTGAIYACPPMTGPARLYVPFYPAPNPGYGRYGWDWWGPERPMAQPEAGTGD